MGIEVWIQCERKFPAVQPRNASSLRIPNRKMVSRMVLGIHTARPPSPEQIPSSMVEYMVARTKWQTSGGLWPVFGVRQAFHVQNEGYVEKSYV